jgi:DNA-directed RNA polymerase specialized sigma24 family protein
MSATDFEDLDQQLERLAVAAKAATSPLERQRSLDRLIRLLSQPQVLYPPQLNRHPPEVHRDLYHETCQRVWIYVCRNIERYDPQKATVRKWVNYLLDKRFIDVVNDRNGRRITYVPDLAELEKPTLSEEVTEVQLLRDCLTQDVTGKFREKHIKGHPEASFQAIALRLMEDKTWKEISAEFQIPIPSLSAFYQRCLKKFLPLLQHLLHS